MQPCTCQIPSALHGAQRGEEAGSSLIFTARNELHACDLMFSWSLLRGSVSITGQEGLHQKERNPSHCSHHTWLGFVRLFPLDQAGAQLGRMNRMRSIPKELGGILSPAICKQHQWQCCSSAGICGHRVKAKPKENKSWEVSILCISLIALGWCQGKEFPGVEIGP